MLSRPCDPLQTIKLYPDLIPVRLVELLVPFELIVLGITCVQGLIGAAFLVIDVHRVVRVFSFEVNCLYLSFAFGFLVVKGVVNVLNWNRKTL